jgi:malate dehydrogenase (oxaloacetate-decarboxylating)(NADP+)
MCEHFVKLGIPEHQAKKMFWCVLCDKLGLPVPPRFILHADDDMDNNGRLVDSKGLVADNRGDTLPEHKLYFSRPEADVPRLTSLIDVIEYVKPTGLLGLSTVGGSFTEDVIRKLADLNKRPIIFALSNPVSKVRGLFYL